MDGAAAAPGPLGRDAYRIVQESPDQHQQARSRYRRPGSRGGIGAPDRGLHVSVRNPAAPGTRDHPALPGSGTGLLGLQERVSRANGFLVYGRDASGDFVVEAGLPW